MRKGLGGVLTLVACVALGLPERTALASGFSPQADAQGPAAPCYIEPRLTEALTEAAAVTPRLERVWPGYWSSPIPVIIYQPGRSALLLADNPPPSPFSRAPDTLLPAALRGRVHFACGALPGLTGNFEQEYRIGDLSAVAVKLETTPYETLEVLYHEAFHRWQRSAFARTKDAASIGLQDEVRGYLEVIREPRFVAAMELERRILAAAVATSSAAERSNLIRQYLAVKQRRTEGMPVPARHTELIVERKEGSASIVGHEAASLAYARPLDRPYAQLWSFMAEPPLSLPAGNSAFARFRMRAFGAGAASAWLLTRMGLSWRRELQQGASFEMLLRRAVGFRADRDAKLADAAEARFGMDQLLRDAEQWRETTKEMNEAEFYRLKPVRLTVIFSRIGGKPPEFQVSHGGLAAVPEENVLIFADTRTARLEYGPISLKSEERPILVDYRGSPSTNAFTLMMDAAPDISGFDSSTGGRITADRLEIKIAAPARLERKGDEIIVRVQVP